MKNVFNSIKKAFVHLKYYPFLLCLSPACSNRNQSASSAWANIGSRISNGEAVSVQEVEKSFGDPVAVARIVSGNGDSMFEYRIKNVSPLTRNRSVYLCVDDAAELVKSIGFGPPGQID